MGQRFRPNKILVIGILGLISGCGVKNAVTYDPPRLRVLPYLDSSTFTVLTKPEPLDASEEVSRVQVKSGEGDILLALADSGDKLEPGQKVRLTMLMLIDHETADQLEYWRILLAKPFMDSPK